MRFKSIFDAIVFILGIEDEDENTKLSRVSYYLGIRPNIMALYGIEVKYGGFEILIPDEIVCGGRSAAIASLTNGSKLILINKNLSFVNSDIKDIIESCVIYGDSLSDLCTKFIDMIFQSRYLVRWNHDNTMGYATSDIRDIILDNKVKLKCIN